MKIKQLYGLDEILLVLRGQLGNGKCYYFNCNDLTPSKNGEVSIFDLSTFSFQEILESVSEKKAVFFTIE